MKLKYTLVRDDESKKLIIKEFGEMDKDLMTLLCEETVDEAVITQAIKEGQSALIFALRSDNLYPPASHVEKIAESVMALFGPEGKPSVDVFFDDNDRLAKAQENEPFEDIKEVVDLDADDEADELDNLLADDDIKIKPASAIKIADDDSVDIDEES